MSVDKMGKCQNQATRKIFVTHLRSHWAPLSTHKQDRTGSPQNTREVCLCPVDVTLVAWTTCEYCFPQESEVTESQGKKSQHFPSPHSATCSLSGLDGLGVQLRSFPGGQRGAQCKRGTWNTQKANSLGNMATSNSTRWHRQERPHPDLAIATGFSTLIAVEKDVREREGQSPPYSPRTEERLPCGLLVGRQQRPGGPELGHSALSPLSPLFWPPPPESPPKS